MHFSAEDFANVSKSTLPASFALSEMARRPQNGVLFTAHTCATAPVSISQEIAPNSAFSCKQKAGSATKRSPVAMTPVCTPL